MLGERCETFYTLLDTCLLLDIYELLNSHTKQNKKLDIIHPAVQVSTKVSMMI